MSAETVRHENTYIIIFLIRHNESIDDDKNYDHYTSPPSSVDDVTMTKQLWRNHMKSDIDFIHGDIHGRSC